MKKIDHQIVQQVLDGEVSRESFDAFQQRMRGEPDLVRFYGEYARLHHTLSEEYEDTEPSVIHAPAAGGKGRPVVPWLLAALVVLLAVLAFHWHSAGKVKGPEVLAGVKFSEDAVWRGQDIFPASQKRWGMSKGATLEIMQGIAEVSVNGGGHALIEGPASLTLVSGELLHLASGRGRFDAAAPGKVLSVTTPSMTVEDLGTEFGLRTSLESPDEVHVLKGRVRMRVNGSNAVETLEEGQAGRIAGVDKIERFHASTEQFPKSLPSFHEILSEPFVKSSWRTAYGSPSISEDRVEGENFSTFMRLPETVPGTADPVMLVTLTVGQLASGVFHTDGWAGLSFFKDGTELLFFGDSYGPERTWSLDVKQHIPVILPGKPVTGPRTITLRYDSASGNVSLHEGRLPLSVAICSGKLPPGTVFDEIRLGASSSAALAVGGLKIRSGGGGR